MSLGYSHKELEIWDGIVEKTEKELATWKTQYLSLGGRTTLVNSVLDALPTYVLSLFPLHVKVEERLDKLSKDFVWMGNNEGKVMHLVKWQTAQLSKQSGGLGVKNLGLHNRSLLLKWLWRFVWRTIRNLWPKLSENICYKVGEGTRILFWKDK
ncbi:unnamed protein product [Withania somnifera]